jgi:S1-C subfamily serine protease
MFAQAFLHLCVLLLLVPAPRDPLPDDKGKGFFGVQLLDNGGVSITRVEPGSPAEKAGIQFNDIILAIDTAKVSTVNDAREIIGRLRPGNIVLVDVRRGEQFLTIKVRVGVRPESAP